MSTVSREAKPTTSTVSREAKPTTEPKVEQQQESGTVLEKVQQSIRENVDEDARKRLLNDIYLLLDRMSTNPHHKQAVQVRCYH